MRLAVAAIVCGSVVAHARSVMLNGIAIDSVTNQRFDNCTVHIDADGNIHITAKGYAVKTVGAQAQAEQNATAQSGAPPTRRYFLVTEKAAPGMTQYDVDVFINAKWVRKLIDEEEHIVMEITSHLRQGPNKVQFVAKKNLGDGPRRSTSPQHYARVIIGEGDSGGRNVMLTKKAIDYKRTALETEDRVDEFTVVAH